MAAPVNAHTFAENDDSVAVLQAAFVTQDSDTACLPQRGTASAHPSSTASSGLSVDIAVTPASTDGRLETMVAACRTILEVGNVTPKHMKRRWANVGSTLLSPVLTTTSVCSV
jgi:hypothetical protein